MIQKTPYLCILLLLAACGDDGGPGTPPDAAQESPDAAQDSPDAGQDSPDATPNRAPVVSDQQVTTDEDTELAINLGAVDLDNDTLEGTVSDPPNGSVTGTPPNQITYTPDENFNGTDTFTVEISDGKVTDTATITVTVTAVNDAPVAQSEFFAFLPIQPLDIELQATDAEGDDLTFTIVTQPENGTLSGEGALQIYTANDGFTGTDGFTFRVSDGDLESEIATVAIVVTAPPTAR